MPDKHKHDWGFLGDYGGKKIRACHCGTLQEYRSGRWQVTAGMRALSNFSKAILYVALVYTAASSSNNAEELIRRIKAAGRLFNALTTGDDEKLKREIRGDNNDG